MIRIGTRKSKLAMIQTKIVKSAIESLFPGTEVELVPMSTLGDRHLDRSLTSFGGKGVFTKDLEEALLDRRIDLAVHSAKDMPMEFPEGLCLGAVLEREDPRDVLVTTTGIRAEELPPGSVIGTSSLRREIQIKQINPRLQMKQLRGNVQTRMEKLLQGEYDGILLAAAGLRRLGLLNPRGYYLEYMNTEFFVPAAGQGILAVESRKGDLEEILEAIHSTQSFHVLKAEREYLRILGGSCNAPCGAYCRYTKEGLMMTGMYARDGVHPVYSRQTVKPDADASARIARKVAAQVRYQPVSFVGAGPGDAGLVTQKGLDCVRRADVILYDNLIPPSILNQARLNAELIYTGKRSSDHSVSQDRIHEILVEKACEGKYAVRLKGGDPFVFGRGGEETLLLHEHGIPFEIVPGVSSSYSVPAYAGIPVTQRNMASSFHVLTGHEGAHKDAEVLDYAVLAKEEGTLVFLMGFQNLGRIASRMLESGKDPDTPAAVIAQGTTGRQKKVVGTLVTILDKAKAAEIKTPAILVIGSVVSLEGELSWFGKHPLSGIRVLLTGTRHMIAQQEAELQPWGAETVALSLVERVPCVSESDLEALKEIADYQWLVFTSYHGVELFFDSMIQIGMDYRKLMHLKFAAVGSGSAGALRKRGFSADFVPTVFSGEDLAGEWVKMRNPSERVMLIRAKNGSGALPEALKKRAIATTELELYETLIDERRKEELNRIVKDVDYITMASPSSVRAFSGMIESAGNLGAKIISIGLVTARAAEAEGYRVYGMADVSTAAGIKDVILADVAKEKGWGFEWQ